MIGIEKPLPVAAAPVTEFTVSPTRPAVGNTVELVDCSHDPDGVGIGWRAWDFGDGSTSVGPAAAHRYASAGEYEITLTLATFDGRIGRAAHTIRVD